MNVSFLQNQPLDTVIIDSANGQPIYEVQTPWRFTNSTTYIRRSRPGVPPGSGETVAEVHWHKLGSTTITFLGTDMRLDNFLRKDGMFSSSRTFTGNDGRLYKWKHESNKFELFDTKNNAMIAQSHRRKLGIIGHSRKMNVDIYPQGMSTIDAIIVSFIIMEEKQRQNNTATASAAAASAASASAASVSTS